MKPKIATAEEIKIGLEKKLEKKVHMSDGLKQLASQPEKLRFPIYFPHLRLLL